MTRRVGGLVLVVALAFGFVAVRPSLVSAATTFVVNKVGDAADMNLADSKCDTSTNTGNQCTLRAAIQEADDTAGIDTINFNIRSTSKTITPNSQLPDITEQVTINGYSQSGSAENTLAIGSNAVLKVVLDGSNVGGDGNGLVLRTNNSWVRGLVIQNWEEAGIHIPGSGVSGGPNVINGNFIGTNAAGTAEAGNGVGVLVEASLQVISDNVISGNGTGVIALPGVANAVITGNYIGTNAAGTAAVANTSSGVFLLGEHAQVGGSSVDERNVISGNLIGGVVIDSGDSGPASHTNVLEGNYIGTKADGTGSLPSSIGVLVANSTDNYIGDDIAGNLIAGNLVGVWLDQGATANRVEANTIKANTLDGIYVETGPNSITGNQIRDNGRNGVRVETTATGVTISTNPMTGNAGLGIDLVGGSENGFGVTSNDADDPDTGANHRQNYPVIVSAIRNPSTKVTEVVVKLDSTPRAEFRIELFRANVDPSGNGEGGARVGVHVVSTDGKGDKTFSFLVANLAVGWRLTATATATATGSTSEFSANRIVSN